MSMNQPKFKDQPEFNFGNEPEKNSEAVNISNKLPENKLVHENIIEGDLFGDQPNEIGPNQEITNAKIELFKLLNKKYPHLVAGAVVEEVNKKSHIVIITVKDPNKNEKLDILKKYKGYDVIIRINSGWPLPFLF